MADSPNATSETAAPPRILSGVQPSGELHLGNYFGAIKQHIELQEAGECYYFIANYHSLTSVRDAESLLQYTQDVATTYLACGLDPERTVFYRQTDVPEVTELTWLLSSVTGMGLLERAHSYKEKVARGITPSVGLFTYPVLMAADILAPQSDVVPVGKDQDQHVQMTRDMAQLFNNAFCPDDPVFKLPTSRFSKASRVPGTTFEKGSVLQVTTQLANRDAHGNLVDLGEYVARFRQRIEELVANAGEEELKTTEELAVAIDRIHDAELSDYTAHERVLRMAQEMPAGAFVSSTHENTLSVEFCTPLERVVFVTRDGRRQAAKMSKSYGNTVPIFLSGKPLKKRVMGIETQLIELEDPIDPDQDIVIQLFELFASEDEVADLAEKYRAGGFGFGRAKKLLLERIDAHFEPFRKRHEELVNDLGYVEDVLRAGAQRARAVIGETVERAHRACGIPPRR